jgi:hypothetical protein
MEAKWYASIREAIHCANEFLKERQDGQIPPNIRAYRVFMDFVLIHNPTGQFRAELIRLMRDPVFKKHMFNGLMKKSGDDYVPGDALRSSSCVIRLTSNTGDCELQVQPLIHFINQYPYSPKQKTVKNPKEVCSYFVKMFAQGILQLARQPGDDEILSAAERNTIEAMTKMPEGITAPYNQYNISTLQEIVVNMTTDEYVVDFASENGYTHMLDMLKRGAKTFSASDVGGAHRIAADVIRQRSIRPAIIAVKELGQKMVIGTSNNGEINSCDQE